MSHDIPPSDLHDAALWLLDRHKWVDALVTRVCGINCRDMESMKLLPAKVSSKFLPCSSTERAALSLIAAMYDRGATINVRVWLCFDEDGYELIRDWCSAVTTATFYEGSPVKPINALYS